MNIPVKFVKPDMSIDYRPEYLGFIFYRYDPDNKRWNSVLLAHACLYKIDRLERIIKFYERVL